MLFRSTSVANLFFGFCSSSSGGRYPSQPFAIIQKRRTMSSIPVVMILQNHVANFFLKSELFAFVFAVFLVSDTLA